MLAFCLPILADQSHHYINKGSHELMIPISGDNKYSPCIGIPFGLFIATMFSVKPKIYWLHRLCWSVIHMEHIEAHLSVII